MKTGVRVADAMTSKPKTVSSSTTLKQCVEEMLNSDIGSLLIIDDCKLLGIITEADLLQKAILENIDKNTPISSFMTTSLVTTEPETDIYEALKLMHRNNLTRLPVLKEEKLVGMLTIKDIIKIQPHIIDWLIEKHHLKESTNRAFIGKDHVEGECDICSNYDELKFYKGKWLCSICRLK